MNKPSARWLRALILPALLASALQAQAAGDEWVYTVRPGDTLIDLASAYLQPGYGWEKLQEINQLADPRQLQPNSRVRIPLRLLRRDAALAEVLRVQGGAEHGGDTQWQRLASGQMLNVGDVVRTDATASVTLRFADGSRLLIAPNSKVRLATLLSFGKTGMADTRLELEKGAVETQVAPQRGGAAKFEVKAPAMNLGVRGTDFRVAVNEDGSVSRSEVVEGKVAAAAQRRTVMLKAGYGTLALNGEAPKPARALLPAPDLSAVAELQERVPLRFKWPVADQAKAYRAQVFAAGEQPLLVLDGTFASPSAKWVDLPDGSYVLRVRSVDAQGLEGLNAERTFRLKARPEAPFVMQPQEGGKVYGEQVQLRWAKAVGVARYRVQLAATADFAQPLLEQTLTANEVANPLPPGSYFWRVASILADGDQGPFTDPIAFTQRKVPASPEVDAPQIGSDQMSFAWKAGEAGERYHFQFARDEAFTDLVEDQQLSEPRIVFKRPDGGDYYMRVKTIDADGFAGPFGRPQMIEVPYSRLWFLMVPAALLLAL